MRHILLSLFIFTSLFAEKETVLVSIAPYAYFIERLAADETNVEVLVPPGASPHTWEPSIKRILQASQAALWFRMGEPFEEQLITAFKTNHPSIKIIDLRDGIDLICDGPGKCSHNMADPHIWLSPPLAKIQAKKMAEALQALIPAKKEKIQKNLENLEEDIDALDRYIRTRVEQSLKKKFLVFHPAWGYFSRTYGLEQIPIETEGREPSPKHVIEVVNFAKKFGLKDVFAQPQHSLAGPKRISEALGGKVILLNPLSRDWLNNLKSNAEAITSQP